MKYILRSEEREYSIALKHWKCVIGDTWTDQEAVFEQQTRFLILF